MISESASWSSHRTWALVDVLLLFRAIWNVPICSFFVEFATAILTWHAVVDFIARLHLIPAVTAGPTATTTSLWFSERDRLPRCLHCLPQHITLGLPLADRCTSFLLLNLSVDCGTTFCHTNLLTVDNTLFARVKSFALLAKHFLADVLMPSQRLRIE